MLITREKIIEEIKRIAKKVGKNQLSRREFHSNSEISDRQIGKLFDSWNEAIEEAGLTPHTENVKIDENNLFTEMERVFLDFGGICTCTKFNKLSKFSIYAYEKRFGHWSGVLKTFRDWLVENNKEFPFMDQLPKIADESLVNNKVIEKEQTKKVTSWDAIGGSTYGALLNFRGLQHAPLNEQGVVFLFGMICSELGFVVEAIQTAYPDCEAKRCIDRSRDKWERVRIEFEYRSSHFKDHGHDHKQCDLIVCWIHNWKECPLEVIELKSVIERINDRQKNLKGKEM